MDEKQTVENEVQHAEQVLSQEELNLKLEQLRLEQNLPFAIIASLVSALVMAVLWAVITVVTNFQIGYMAVAVGFVVGFAVRFAGKGIDTIYGIIGALGALLGCIIGNFLTQVGFIAQDPELGMSYFEGLKFLLANMQITLEIMKETFSMIDLLFYGIAIYEGFRFSFRKIE